MFSVTSINRMSLHVEEGGLGLGTASPRTARAPGDPQPIRCNGRVLCSSQALRGRRSTPQLPRPPLQPHCSLVFSEGLCAAQPARRLTKPPALQTAGSDGSRRPPVPLTYDCVYLTAEPFPSRKPYLVSITSLVLPVSSKADFSSTATYLHTAGTKAQAG